MARLCIKDESCNFVIFCYFVTIYRLLISKIQNLFDRIKVKLCSKYFGSAVSNKKSKFSLCLIRFSFVFFLKHHCFLILSHSFSLFLLSCKVSAMILYNSNCPSVLQKRNCPSFIEREHRTI